VEIEKRGGGGNENKRAKTNAVAGDDGEGQRCPKLREHLLNRTKVRDSEHVDDGGDKGGATFDGKSLKKKRNTGMGSGRSKAKRRKRNVQKRPG